MSCADGDTEGDVFFYNVRERLAANGTLHAAVAKLDAILGAFPCGSLSTNEMGSGNSSRAGYQNHNHSHTNSHNHSHTNSHNHSNNIPPPHNYHHHHHRAAMHPHQNAMPGVGSHHHHHPGRNAHISHLAAHGGHHPTSRWRNNGASYHAGSHHHQRTVILGSNTSHNVRKMTAALNKLTDRNYAAISKIVSSMCLANAIPQRAIVQLILAQSCKQSCYAEVFVRLLRDVLAISPLAAGPAADVAPAPGAADVDLLDGCVEEFCKEFMDMSFLTSQDELAELLSDVGNADSPHPCPNANIDTGNGMNSVNSVNSVNSYDNFCAYMKAKTRIMGKGRTIVYIISHGLLPGVSKEDYVEGIKLGIETIVSKHKTTNSHKNDIMLDLMYDLFLDYRAITERCARVQGGRQYTGKDNDNSDYFSNLLSQTITPRLRFKLMDILQM